MSCPHCCHTVALVLPLSSVWTPNVGPAVVPFYYLALSMLRLIVPPCFTPNGCPQHHLYLTVASMHTWISFRRDSVFLLPLNPPPSPIMTTVSGPVSFSFVYNISSALVLLAVSPASVHGTVHRTYLLPNFIPSYTCIWTLLRKK